jgi:hypothetical protein
MKMAPNARIEQDEVRAATLPEESNEPRSSHWHEEQPIRDRRAAAAEHANRLLRQQIGSGDCAAGWTQGEQKLTSLVCSNGKNVIGRALMFSYEARRGSRRRWRKDFMDLSNDQFISVLEQVKQSQDKMDLLPILFLVLERDESFQSNNSRSHRFIDDSRPHNSFIIFIS